MSYTVAAIRLETNGSPEVLNLVDLPLPEPGPGQVRVRHSAIGVNFIDTYQRSGLYPIALPSGLGQEASGVVESLGEGVSDFRIGDRVSYVHGLGAYSSAQNVPAERLVPLPAEVGHRQAAAIMLKGMTAEYLIRRIARVERGMVVLLHAAAGGVGLIASQWLSHLGATVIGTVSTEAKAKLALQHGCARAVVWGRDELATVVKDVTAGQGVAVVFDSIGRDTFDASLASLKPRGLMISFGNASGPPPALDILELSRRGSLFLTRPKLGDYIATSEDLRDSAKALFHVVGRGFVKVALHHTFPLAEAAAAHRLLESRGTTGSVVLIP